MVTSFLSRGLLRGHRRQNLLLFGVFTLSFLGFLTLVMVSGGASKALVEPLQRTITGDMRITEGTEDLTRGAVWDDHRNVTELYRDVPGAVASPRYESNYVTVKGTRVQNWSAGLMIGLDPRVPEERAGIESYMIEGSMFKQMDVTNPETGEVYAPIVVGKPVAERLGVEFTENGTPVFDEILTLSSGRTPSDRGGVQLPISIDAVVVGVFETGLEPLDKLAAFAPIEWVRVAEGYAPGDPIANAVIVHGGEEDVLESTAEDEGYMASSPNEYALNYLGGMLVIMTALTVVQIVLYTVLLMVWLGYEVNRRVKQEERHIAALRAVGIPSKALRRAYLASIIAVVGAAALVALVIALIVGTLAPAVPVTISGVTARIPWVLNKWAFIIVGVGVLIATIVAARQATWSLEQVDIRDGLQAS